MLKIELYMGTHAVHPVDQALIDYPPKGVIYQIKKPGKSWNWMKNLLGKSFVVRKLYQKYRGSTQLWGKPNVDLIHACRRLVPGGMKWVADFENVGSFLGYPLKGWDSSSHKRILERTLSSPSLKKLIAWSEAGEKSLLNSLDPSGFRDKLEVVYPAIPSVKFRGKKKSDKVTLLHVSRGFRGGRLTLEAFEKIGERYDVALMMRADVPKEFLKKYASMDNVKFISKLPSRDHVFELFKNADIFVMPSMMEGFGYVYLEAMNFGLPVVALKIHSAIREIVDDGKTGYLVEPEVSIYNPDYTFRNGGLFWGIDEYEQPRTVDGLVEKLSRLIEDEALRRRMGREGKKEIERGKFSIGERNEKLKRIYEEAIKK